MTEYFKNYILDVSKEYAYDLCERFYCAPQELAQELTDDCYDLRDVIDCSFYPKCYEIDGEYWYFESRSGGQHDTRDEMKLYVNKEAYDALYELWDKYHLKKVGGIKMQLVEELKKQLSQVDEEEWITNYINEHIDELRID